jgi:hypothetical protein
MSGVPSVINPVSFIGNETISYAILYFGKAPVLMLCRGGSLLYACYMLPARQGFLIHRKVKGFLN